MATAGTVQSPSRGTALLRALLEWRKWRYDLVGLSIANLAFFPRWKQMLNYSASDAYLMKLPPAPAEYWAAISGVVILGSLLGVITQFISEMKPGRFFRLARCCWLLLLLKPMYGFVPEVTRLVELAIGGSRFHLVLIGLALVTVAFALWPVAIYRWAMQALLILSPYVAVTMGQSAWAAVRYEPAAFLDKPNAPLLASNPSDPRVVWLVLDEMDQRLAFEDRPRDLQMPELDGLRAVSVYASHAYPPAGETLHSIPGLILGKKVVGRQVGPSELLLSDNGTGAPTSWAGQANVFSRARALGFNTALGGWYHPYGRILAPDLTRCYWFAMEEWMNVTSRTFAESFWKQMAVTIYLPYAQTLVMRERVRRRTAMMWWARAIVKDKSLGLIFLHLPAPHVPYVYDRLDKRFVTQDPEGRGYNPRHYVDGLALADRSLRVLRQAMSEENLWDSTTVIVSSDHWYRRALEFDGKMDRRVPFLVKLARQRAGLTFDAAFNTVITQELVLAILKKEVASADDVPAWLERHRGDVPAEPLLIH